MWAILARRRELYARHVQILEQDPEDPALPETRLQMERLFAGHKPSRIVATRPAETTTVPRVRLVTVIGGVVDMECVKRET